MRIVNRKEFLKLPDGTLYSSYYGSSASRLEIKEGGDWGNDWFYTNLLTLWSEAESGSEDYFYKLSKAESNSNFSFSQDLESSERDGRYEEDQLFVVFEKEDILKIINKLQSIIK